MMAVMSALGWGAVAASSVVLGALLALWRHWPERWVGAVLAFGAGALISAVSFELALQGFTFAQLRMPSSLLIATFGTALRSPKTAPHVWDGYLRGRAASFLPPVRFESMWDEKLDVVRERLAISPARA